ncbi:acyltransferase family protein [Parvibaculum sp.]|jgi:peptidoglycan/LPS O-acetylase OafA/YrhL|uniref:acyltransferase family protein n=1 Tax=Parvibaculum sp. TaxID=2024848 RepID=UPI002FDA3728
MRYRPDIDGIRTLAVVPVVLFHAGIWPFTGGYVGVDVFFVISGYLITGILLADIQSGTFSLTRFYERRIRRIFPALFLVLALCLVASAFILLPSYFEDFSESLFATAIFASNFQFWRESGYFGADAELAPLLHTWSLAVEEQFYVFIPLLLLFACRHSMAMARGLLATIFVVSFALSVYYVREAPSAAFYLTPMRAWELMAGCLLAVGVVPRIERQRVAQAVSAIGVLLIAIAVFGFDSTTPFPGAAALLPVLGTAALIHAGETHSTLVGRVLSSRLFVFIGLISYSLYLFHWPIFVFYRHLTGADGDMAVRLLLVLLSGVLAWLSWRYFERPFRTRSTKAANMRVFAGGSVVAMLFLGAGFWGNAAEGWPDRFHLRFDPKPVMATGKSEMMAILGHIRCRVTDGETVLVEGVPCDEDNQERMRIALLGDSHASHLYPGLHAAFPDADIEVYGAPGCRVLFGIDTRPDREDCATIGSHVYGEAFEARKFDAIILASRWEASDLEFIRASVRQLLRHTGGVTVIGPVPRYKVMLPEALAIWPGDYSDRFFDLNEDREVARIDAAMQQALAREDVNYISLYQGLCRSRKCRIFADEEGTRPLQWDEAHLTLDGSRFVAARIIAPGLRLRESFGETAESRRDRSR